MLQRKIYLWTLNNAVRINSIAFPTHLVAVSVIFKKSIATSRKLHSPFAICSTTLHVPWQNRATTGDENVYIYEVAANKKKS